MSDRKLIGYVVICKDAGGEWDMPLGGGVLFALDDLASAEAFAGESCVVAEVWL